MLFMVIERFKDSDAISVYKRLQESGRMMPEGLTYLDSWVEANLGRCFQLMECENVSLFQQWILSWRDLVDFEIVPVTKAADTKAWVIESFSS